MSEPKSREGTQFGPYRLLRLIGKGGMGEVYEAQDTVKDRVVALKLLPELVSHDPVFRKRLQREAHSAGRLQEPHVVPIHDYGEIDGVLFVDMRMINGSDLRKILKNFGPMTPARGVAIVRQVASAIDAAHEGGVMHRDVKPENILINRDDFAYLVDFGIANAASDEKLTELGTAVGTYAYMAPERFTNDEVTYRADIYALACVLHECLTGSQPYAGDSVSVVITAHLMQPIPRPSVERPGIPSAFDGVIAKGMAKKPEDRYASAGDLAMAATEALTARDQDQAETILARSTAATLPSLHVDPATVAALGATPPPTPPPGATPPPMPFGTPPPPTPYGATAPPIPYGGTPAPFAATTPASFPTTPPPPPPPPPHQFGFTGPPSPPPTGPGGGPSWTPPPPPGSGPQGGKKVPWIPIAAAAGVFLLVLAAVGIFFLVKPVDKASGPTTPTMSTATTSGRSTATRTRTTTPPPSGDPDSFEAKLMALIPPGYPKSVCERAGSPSTGALVTIDCRKSTQPGGPDAARYSLFADLDQLTLHFNESIKENDEVLRCPGATEDSPVEWNYKSDPDVVAGSVACGTYQGNADVMWTQNKELMLADVQSTDMDQLHEWWLNYS
jgi:serine/threonine protein kinase